MSKFNHNEVKHNDNITYEGGRGYEKNPVQDWLNFLMSANLENRFYESAGEQTERFVALTNRIGKEYGPEFVGKCAHFARNEIGMRSIVTLTAAILNEQTFPTKRSFFGSILSRPDDVAELFAAIDKLGGKRSNAAVRGAKDYLNTLNEYQIGKYKMKGKEYNMYDLINITHAHSDAITKYKNDILDSPDTWEVKMSAASSQEERKDEWKRLVKEKKLGYLALIRNLRNIMDADIDESFITYDLVPQLINEEKIKKSNVFPYQIYTAYKNMEVHNFYVVSALEKAFRIACGNVDKLPGKSVILLDVSGSMDCPYSKNSCMSIKEIGACYAAMMYISQDCDFVKFGNTACKKVYNKLDNVFSIIDQMVRNDGCGWGTNERMAFAELNQKYDRIFLVSDMQVMDEPSWCNDREGINYKQYCSRYGNTDIYSFDLGNYASSCLDNKDNPYVHFMTSLDDSIFHLIALCEDGEDIIDYINKQYDYTM